MTAREKFHANDRVRVREVRRGQVVESLGIVRGFPKSGDLVRVQLDGRRTVVVVAGDAVRHATSES